MKPGPILAMVALLCVGVWLVLQPALGRPRGQFIARVGAAELRFEQRRVPGSDADGAFEYLIVNRPELGREWLTSAEFETLLAREWAAWSARPAVERTLLGFFNITSWANFSWIVIGLAGQVAFFGRMLVQWIVSEKRRESVVPTLFWWLSLGGGICLFLYFVWRVDFVGVLGQSTGIVIYARNLRLISKQKRRAARRLEGTGLAADPTPEPTGL